MIVRELQKEAAEDNGAHPFHDVQRIHCRLYNYEPLTPLKKLKANYYGMLL